MINTTIKDNKIYIAAPLQLNFKSSDMDVFSSTDFANTFTMKNGVFTTEVNNIKVSELEQIVSLHQMDGTLEVSFASTSRTREDYTLSFEVRLTGYSWEIGKGREVSILLEFTVI